MKRDDSGYLRHILDAIAKIEKYLQGKDEVAFNGDTLLQDGVIRQIEIIGEAAKQLSRELRARYSHIPWQGNYLPGGGAEPHSRCRPLPLPRRFEIGLVGRYRAGRRPASTPKVGEGRPLAEGPQWAT